MGRYMDSVLSRAAISIAIIMFAAIASLIGALFLCGAVYLALSEIIHPPLAALVTGIIIIVFSAAAITVLRVLSGGSKATSSSSGRECRANKRLNENATAAEFGNLLGKQIQEMASAHPPETVIASLVAGFAVGSSPGLRKYLGDLIKG